MSRRRGGPEAPPPPPSPDGLPVLARRAGVPPSHRVPAHLARRFHQVCLGITAEVTARVGLTPIEYAALVAIEDAPDIDQGSLAARIGMDTASAHHLVHRLAGAGLVERRVHELDRRARVLRLTPRGHALRRDLRPGLQASQNRILAPLAPRDRAAFLEMLTRVIEAHEAYARPGNGRRRGHQERLTMPADPPSSTR